MKHTPGPWEASAVSSVVGSLITSKLVDGNIGAAFQRGYKHETEANAHLISAAPELLETCRKLANEAAGFLALSDVGRHGQTNSRILRQRIEEARYAIAKAEGGQ